MLDEEAVEEEQAALDGHDEKVTNLVERRVGARGGHIRVSDSLCRCLCALTKAIGETREEDLHDRSNNVVFTSRTSGQSVLATAARERNCASEG